jgi:hypothetical protein
MFRVDHFPLGILTDFLGMIRLVVENEVDPIASLPFSHPSGGRRLDHYTSYEKHLIRIIGELVGPREMKDIDSLVSARSYVYKNESLLGPADKYLERLIDKNLETNHIVISFRDKERRVF